MNRSVSSLRFLLLHAVLLLTLLFTGCGSESSASRPPEFDRREVLIPSAPGESLLGNELLSLDISNQNLGYLTASNLSSEKRMHLQVTDPNASTCSYFIEPDTSAVIPFSGGDGTYYLIGYQQASGSRYAALFSHSLDIQLDNEFLPFLYPNQYVFFTPDTEACLLAQQLAEKETEDLSILENIYEYVISHISYDYDKAETVEAGYLPDVDETLSSGTGICFDYAALTAAMLRACDIPCKLQIGYTGDIKHAWIDVYLQETGWINQIIYFEEDTWKRMDPTFASGADSAKDMQEYIEDPANYTVQFTR
ncbi:MAG: transglutaminase-like domain-containing protein [Eubacteriales bacterium]|nr:transglutaminase-like domain-containing protein [Eubacteriales bacterium]